MDGLWTGLRCIGAAWVWHRVGKGLDRGSAVFHKARLGFALDWNRRGQGTGCVA